MAGMTAEVVDVKGALLKGDIEQRQEIHMYVQAGLAINDNYGMWLPHHQNLSSGKQKSSRHIRLDILNRFAKGISAKIVHSKLGGFINVLINLTPESRFFGPTFMCKCLLVE